MFTNYTLCPNGAFMMHESVAEFDPNAVAPPEQAVAKMEAVKTELAERPGYCPISAVMTKLQPLYDLAQELYTTEISYEYKKDLVAMLDRCSDAASKFADEMRAGMVKLDALRRFVESEMWRNEPLRNYGAFFLRNINRIVQEGYDQFTYTTEYISDFGIYDINRKLSAYMELDELLPDLPADPITIESYYGAKPRFSSTMDFLNCFFKDPDRLARLIRSESRTYELQSLVATAGYVHADGCEASSEQSIQRIMKWMSCALRAVKMEIYNLECDLMDPDGKYEMSDHRAIRKILSGTINLFIIPAVFMIANAFEMKGSINYRSSLESYVNEILKHFGVKPGDVV